MSKYVRYNSYPNFNYGLHITKTVKTLILANVGMFILTHIFRGFPWYTIFGMVPNSILQKFMIWQVLTYMFLHANLWHLVLNMLMLWFFGPAIEASWGRKQFLFYYFFTGIGAAFCSFIVSFNSSIPVVGASGAIFGILVAYALMYPENIILLFFIFPMKMKHAVVVLAVINLLGAISSPGSGIAYIAHLGGALFGYIFLKNEIIKRKLSYFRLGNVNFYPKKKDSPKREFKQEGFDRKVDMILDKISKHGMKSLTKEERKILEIKSQSGKR